MAVNSLIGKKIDQTQAFLEDGTRVPVSRVLVSANVITQIKNQEKEGYNSIQFGIDNKKNPTKPLVGHAKKAGIRNTPRFLQEIRIDKTEDYKMGDSVKAEDVFKAGDLVDVVGISKGKGFAGVVKRYHFRGGPRTHGQSDRERAPGSIGQTTTPGRVYKGKKMAGRMGSDRVTIKNLQVLDVDKEVLYIKGLIPGVKKGVILVKKIGEDKKFVSLFKKIKKELSSDKALGDKGEMKNEK